MMHDLQCLQPSAKDIMPLDKNTKEHKTIRCQDSAQLCTAAIEYLCFILSIITGTNTYIHPLLSHGTHIFLLSSTQVNITNEIKKKHSLKYLQGKVLALESMNLNQLDLTSSSCLTNSSNRPAATLE